MSRSIAGASTACHIWKSRIIQVNFQIIFNENIIPANIISIYVIY